MSIHHQRYRPEHAPCTHKCRSWGARMPHTLGSRQAQNTLNATYLCWWKVIEMRLSFMDYSHTSFSFAALLSSQPHPNRRLPRIVVLCLLPNLNRFVSIFISSFYPKFKARLGCAVSSSVMHTHTLSRFRSAYSACERVEFTLFLSDLAALLLSHIPLECNTPYTGIWAP